MEEISSPGGFSDMGTEASPMSNIISDLSRSTLDSGSTKKRYFQRSKGSCGVSHRTSGQPSEGFVDAYTFDVTTVDITMPKERFSNLRNIFSKELNRNLLRNTELEEHNKENDDTSNDSYIPTPKTRCKKVRCPLENCELNMYDNSRTTSPIINKEKRRPFHVGAAIRRMSMESQHSSESMMRSITSPSALPYSGLKSQKKNFMRSLSSGYESMDDVNDLMNEIVDMESIDDKPQLPTGISKLLSGDIVASETSMDCDVSTTPSYNSRSDFQARVKWLNSTPSMSKIRTCLFRSPTTTCSPRTRTRRYSYDEKSPMSYCLEAEISPQTTRAYKRTSDEMPTDEMSMLKKSRNSFYLNATPTSANSSALARSKLLQRSLSETEAHANIKWAIHRSATDSDLIGDFSKACALPITIGHHPDLKAITSETLAALLRGEFNDRVHSYRIIDCRYPYEYEGGHIAGALNLYNMDLVERTLLQPLTTSVPKILPDINKRNILVFHCEFSWERGPSLSRFLRRLDRERNKEHYPALHYPEIYLLHGGYEKFYSEQKDFCLPQDYKPMKHPDHEEEFKFFRSKSKSWQGDKAKGISQTVVRTNLKRLGL